MVREIGADEIVRLANGSSIHTISALLLQLVQASTHGVASRIRKLRSSLLEMETGEDGGKIDTLEEVRCSLRSSFRIIWVASD